MAIVFDTYAWIEYFNATKKGIVVQKYLESDDVITPTIVLLELSYKSEKEGWDFNKHLNFIKTNSRITGVNEKFILTFGKAYNNIRKKIKKIGITDIIVIHTAEMNDAKILTGDEHFKEIVNTIML